MGAQDPHFSGYTSPLAHSVAVHPPKKVWVLPIVHLTCTSLFKGQSAATRLN